jgi:tetratricopeptide (TPR) repeat protein
VLVSLGFSNRPSIGLGREAWARIRVITIVGALVTLVPFLLLQRLEAIIDRSFLETTESQYYLPSEQWVVPLSLGYREAAAGVIWVRFLAYFGEEHEVRGSFDHLEPYLMSVVELDPYFYRAYSVGSMYAIYNGTLITRADVELSIRMLERGLRYFPDDGDLHYYLGFQYYFELPQTVGDDEAERARRTGMDELCTAALLGGGPAFLPLLCSSMAERRGLDDVAQERLLQTLVETEDERTRTRIEERLERLMTPDAAYRLMERVTSFRVRWQREMPYAPLGFYVVAGPVPPVPEADQVALPLPMDAMIRAADEELFYSDAPEAEEPAGP